MTELYPLKFEPIYKNKIWGGRNLATRLKKDIPDGNIGESWEISIRKDETSVITNGPFTGKDLTYLLENKSEELLGNKIKKEGRFPLLIKFLDAHQKLSVQVHPTEEYSHNNKNASSKTEMWYILDAEPGAKIVYGIKSDVDKKDLRKAVKSGELDDHLREVSVKPGDFYFIPGGTVHAIEEGILLAEIQQNSDTTYRLYDWDRTDDQGRSRALHIEEAFASMNIPQADKESKSKRPKVDFTFISDNYTEEILTASPYFAVEKVKLDGSYDIQPDGERFYILMNISKKLDLEVADNSENGCVLNKGETTLIPAELNKVTVKGKGEFLKVYIPTNKDEIVNRLKNKEFSDQEITQLPGIEYF